MISIYNNYLNKVADKTLITSRKGSHTVKKYINILLLSLLIVALSGCGKESEPKEYSETTISFDKDGKITQVIVEEFDEPYYTEDGLKAFFNEKIKDFNSTNFGNGNVELKALSVSDGLARATLSFDSCDTYKDFSGNSIFFGTVSEAYDKGYITETVLKAYGEEKTISKNELMKMSKDNIIVVSEVVRVTCPQKIAYTSANIEIIDDRMVRISSDSTGLAYIVLK